MWVASTVLLLPLWFAKRSTTSFAEKNAHLVVWFDNHLFFWNDLAHGVFINLDDLINLVAAELSFNNLKCSESKLRILLSYEMYLWPEDVQGVCSAHWSSSSSLSSSPSPLCSFSQLGNRVCNSISLSMFLDPWFLVLVVGIDQLVEKSDCLHHITRVKILQLL